MPTSVETAASIPPINPESLRNLLVSDVIAPWTEAFLRELHPDGQCCEECQRRITDIIDGYGISYRSNTAHNHLNLSNLYDDVFYRHNERMNRIFVSLTADYRNFMFGIHNSTGANGIFNCRECCNRLEAYRNDGDSYYAFENVNSTFHGFGTRLLAATIRQYGLIHTTRNANRTRPPLERDMTADAERAISSGHQERTIV